MQARRFALKTISGTVAAALASGLSSQAFAQTAPKEGVEYRLVKPQIVMDDAKKIEVVEFFWYGCPHCNAIEPSVVDWAKRLPADVVFKKVHVPFREVKHQQLFFTLEALGLTESLTPKVFAAIHVDKNPLDKPELMTALLEKSGLDKKKFMDAYAGFTVQTRMRKATQLASAYGVDGVPAFGVNGKFYTAPSMAGSNGAALRLLDTLIAQERKLLPK
jgi:protein dithiol oxidoreductase (disulfide-forming)